MITSYQYRLKPNYEQRCRLTRWLDMLRCQYNWLLAERFDWWEMNRTTVNACPNTCRDKSVPNNPTVDIKPTEDNSLGVDAGLEYFAACSDGTLVKPPKFYRQSENNLGKLQSKRDLRAIGSKARRKLNQRIARLHQRIVRQRKQWHYEVAGQLLDRADVVFIEDLKVSNMARRNKPKQDEEGSFLPNGQSAKSGLNKSFADAGIAGFLNEILPDKAEKAGKRVIKVNPAGTSQHCAVCLNRVSKSLSERWHDCPHCGASMPRDLCSGILIKKVGLGIASLKNAKSRKRDGEARALIYD